MEDIIKLTGTQIGAGVAAGKLNPADVFSFYQNRSQKLQPKLNSFVEIYAAPQNGAGKSPLAGVPIAIKDNICIKGKKITCASRILGNHTAVYDATVITRLKDAGLQIIGTANMDEFAFGSSTENSCYGVVRNPWDTSRVPGGSSGGSAAIVACRQAPLALGSDTGGSIRQPAALCGVVGLKPTYGRVSRFGLVAFGSSLDQIGPITTNFTDTANLMNILCGFDKNDSTSNTTAVPDFTKSLVDDTRGLRVGLPKEYFGEGLDITIREKIEEAIGIFKNKKAVFTQISLPHTEYAVAVYYIIGTCEASSNLQRFDGIRYGLAAQACDLKTLYSRSRHAGFGDEAKRRILLGTYGLSSGYYDAYYVRALAVRRLIKDDFDKAFKDVDIILTPTSPVPAFKIGEKSKDPLSMYLSDIYTISANLAGLPAVSLPCGFTPQGLPVGMQLIGKEFDEETLIRAGYSYQCATDWHQEIPAIK